MANFVKPGQTFLLATGSDYSEIEQQIEVDIRGTRAES